MSSESYYIGIDVGTGSARAGLVKANGDLVASFSQDTQTWRDPNDHRIFEQSTTDIWKAICKSVKTVLEEAKVPKEAVKGVGFDATCSLAVSDENGEPVTVTKGDSLGQSGERNIILWADHRAEEEAGIINASGTVPLKFVGGTMSLEMEIPKILWLKKRMDSKLFSRCQFFDLPDFLTYHATNNNTRSYCSITCKCSYVPSESGWQASFFEKIGLEEFVKEDFRQLGATNKNYVLGAGMPIGKGLSKKAADELGLVEGTPVGSGVIDAYAGWLGTVAARFSEKGQVEVASPSVDESRHRLAAVAGTSTCYVVNSPKGVFVPGVWGPYRDVVFPGWWMNEGGQSSTGQLIDFMITTHPAYPELLKITKEKNSNIHTVLHEHLVKIQKEEGAETFTDVIKDVHMYPDLHGNRSPIADPRMRGSIVGLTLDSTLSDLARKFHLTLEAIALQTRHIVDEMNANGHQITSIYMSGSQAKNAALMSLLANCCNMPVVLPASASAAVVLGAAMLGRFAHEASTREKPFTPEEQGEVLWKAMVEMTPTGTVVRPDASPREKKMLETKYKIFREAIEIQKRWRKDMEEASR